MELAQQGQSDRMNRESGAVRPVVIRLGGVVAALAVMSVAWALLAGPGTRSTASGASSADPFVQPAAIEFRQGERELRASSADPPVQPAAIEFRQGERELRASSADPLVQPAAIEFRQGERELRASSADPLVQPAAIEFRQGERETRTR
jgi:hypothetical protein